MNSTISLLIGALLIIGIGGLVYLQMDSDEISNALPPVSDTASTNTTGEQQRDATAPRSDDDVNDDGDDDVVTGNTNTGGANSIATPPTSAQAITLAVVAQHNTRSSCWSAISGSVYDLTSWIPKHPGGGQGILNICGKDGSARFNGQHGGAAKQAAILVGFKIGVLQ